MDPRDHDWSLERQGLIDQARHVAKIKEAIRQHLDALISEESLIASNGRRILRVPIRSLEEFKFRYDPWAGEHVGQGEAARSPGHVLGRLRPADDHSPGGGSAGGDPGRDVYEVEVSVDDLAALLFEQLDLPRFVRKSQDVLTTPTPRFRDIRKAGPMGNLDKRRTLRENLLRRARHGQPGVGPIHEDDLRFRSWVEDPEEDTAAVIIAMRDVSGSMGDFKKLMARTFFFWMVRFLRTRYRSVTVAFVVHHTQAREVDEETFFQLGESGGTKVSSAYELCLELMRARYPESAWNVYPFHFSDGDNWSEADNRKTVDLLREILPAVRAFGYAEIREAGYTSSLMAALHTVDDRRLKTVSMARREDVLPALREFFHADDPEEGGLP